MRKLIGKVVRKFFGAFGYEVVRAGGEFPPDFEAEEIEIIRRMGPFCMTPPERIYALCKAVRYIVRQQIPGDIVECGVWRGGSMMAVARTLMDEGDQTVNLYLFDTFEGMPAPSDHDRSFRGDLAEEVLAKDDLDKSAEYQGGIWAYASLEEVRRNLATTGYDQSKIHFVKGLVEDTIPDQAPSKISLLRLDTDWYESTRHEMVHLFPRLSPGGVIIVDDYGHWEGVRKAVDEYFEEQQPGLLLNRIDYASRIGVVLKD